MSAIAEFLNSGQKNKKRKSAISSYLDEQEAAKHVETPRIGNDYNKLFGTSWNPNPLKTDTAQVDKIVATARQLPKVQPSKPTSLVDKITHGLQTFNAYSNAITEPFEDALTFGLTKRIREYGGINPIEAQNRQFIPESTRNVLGTVGGAAGSIGAFGSASKFAGQPLANLAGKMGLGKYGQAIAKYGGTMAAFEGLNSATQGNSPLEIAKKTGEGFVLGAVAGPAGEYVGRGVNGALGGRLGHYAGNALGGATTGLGFSYGGNLMEGQPLDNAEAGKNAIALGILSVATGGKYRLNRLETAPPVDTAPAAETVATPAKQYGTLTPKNTAYDIAINEYNSAVEQIQNHFMTNELRADEIARIKPELGIDLEQLVGNIQRAESGVNLGQMGNRGRMAITAGVNDMPTLRKPEFAPKVNTPELNPQANTGANRNPIDTRNKIVTSKKANSTGFWDKMENLYTRTVDTQFPISKFTNEGNLQGLTPKVLASNARNSQGITSHILETGLVNKEGQQIGESYKSILKAIPKQAEKDFADYLLHKHNIARMAQDKPVFGSGITAEMSAAKVAEYEALHPEFKQIGDKLSNFIDTLMKTWGVDTGLLTPEQYQAMKEMYPNYVPTYRSFSELEKGSNPFGKKGKSFVGQSSGIKKTTGSDRPVIDPLESIMGLVDKTVKAAKYNEVGQSIVQAIKENPEGLKRWAEIVPTKDTLMEDINKTLKEEGIEGVMEKFNEQFDQNFSKTALGKDNIVRVMVDGHPVHIKINDKSFLDAVKGLSQSDAGTVEKAFRKGTGVFKALITGKNPLFALRNIARDIPTAYINGSEKNPAKFLVDLLTAGKDIVTQNPQFKEYRALGGGQSNFFAQDTNLLKRGGSLPRKIGRGIEAFNNLTETAPRYAEFKRVTKRGGGDYASKQQGLYAANDVTTNFSRNGDIVKSADAYVPYLNPAFQGLDKTVRQFRNHPIGTILKSATIITAPTLLLNHINKDDPNYKALDNRTKDTYFLIPKGDGTFFKLPKSRELGVLFGSLTERILRKIAGEPESFKGFGNTVATNFAPANPIESNFLSPLLTNIPKNKDFANRTIVPQTMQDRSPRYQYDDQTSEIAKKIGELTNLSPKQIDYLITSYTGVIGQLGLPATTKSTYQSGSNVQKLAKPITKQFTADPLFSNQAVSDFYDNYDKLKTVAADKNFVESVPSKMVTPEEKQRNAFLKASKEISAITKQIKEEDIKGNTLEVQRLRRKIIDIAEKANQLVK